MINNNQDILPQEVAEAVRTLVDTISVDQLIKNLRKMLFVFLNSDHDIIGYDYTPDLLHELEALFELLDIIEFEMPY